MTGDRGRLARNPFHEIAVAAKNIDAVLEQLKARTVVPRGEPLGGDGHADASADALPQRPRRRFNAGRFAKLGMTSTRTMKLAKVLDVVEGDRQPLLKLVFVLRDLAHANQVQYRIQQH